MTKVKFIIYDKRRGLKILRGAPKIFRHPKGDTLKNLGGVSENLYTSKLTGGEGAPKKLNR